ARSKGGQGVARNATDITPTSVPAVRAAAGTAGEGDSDGTPRESEKCKRRDAAGSRDGRQTSAWVGMPFRTALPDCATRRGGVVLMFCWKARLGKATLAK